jgi:hypothetical protein
MTASGHAVTEHDRRRVNGDVRCHRLCARNRDRLVINIE